MNPLVLKAIHVLSVALFLGNIITGIFWKAHADNLGDLRARAQALDGIIKADRLFTLPGVILIIVTGAWMANISHIPLLGMNWAAWGLYLFGATGVIFQLFVGPLQKKMLANTRAGVSGTWDETQYQRLSRQWQIWGGIATLLPIIIVFLMVPKPDLGS